jgi:hypothetical protein
MSWKEIVCVCVIVIGMILFLYGANYYNAVIGWTGFSLMIGGFFAEIVFKVCESIRKKESVRNRKVSNIFHSDSLSMV